MSALVTFLKLFKDISADAAMVESATEHRTYKEGDVLLREGTVAKELFFIVSGVLKINALNEKGNDVTYFFIRENQFCTILKSFNEASPAGESIIAACDVQVLAIPKAKLEKLYAQLPYMKELINQIIQQRLIDKIGVRNAYMGNDAVARYKLFIMREPDIALRVSQADIASYLGITPQSLSRIRKNMQ